VGLMTMAPLVADTEAARPCFRGLRTLRDSLAAEFSGRYELTELSMGTSNDFEVAVEEGATIVKIGKRSTPDRKHKEDRMAGGGLWRKTLVYFGLADEDDEYYDELPSVRRDEEPSYRDAYRDRSKVKRIDRDSRRRPSSDFDDIFAEDDYRDRAREERVTPFSPQRGAPLRRYLAAWTSLRSRSTWSCRRTSMTLRWSRTSTRTTSL